jgi:hypothetical protein
LEVDLSSRSTPEPIPATPAGLELQRRVLKFAGVDTSIQLLGRTAIIDASLLPVDSIELVKTLLSFEPGIDRIEIVNKQTTHE